ncbi:hypothetical protein ACVWW6_009069 [Bradyrhizobium sp. USDA 3311]
MKTDRFSYETSRWSAGQPEQTKRYFEELEMMGPQNVRARLAQTDAGSRGAFSIGSIQMSYRLRAGMARVARSPARSFGSRAPQSTSLLDALCCLGRGGRSGKRSDRLDLDDYS